MVSVAVPEDGLALEAVWQEGGAGGGVVAAPHPLYGGSMDNPVCNEVAYGLYKAGYASLRFNWRGVNASQGSPSGDPAEADRDYRAALEHVAESAPAPLLACGYSFGAAAALRASLADERVRRLVLVAPPVDMIAPLDLERIDVPTVVIAGGNDTFAPLAQLTPLLEKMGEVRLEVIAGADHFFASGGLAEIAEIVEDALRR